MKKKILISTVAIIMILSMSLMIFAGCNNKPTLAELNENFPIPTAEIGANGNELPSDTVEGGIKPVNKDMSAFEMLQIGMANFYNAKYASIEYVGGVKMTLLGIPVNQIVQSTKIRRGIGDADGNNANGATYFADNKSYSTFAKIYEKFIIKPDEWTRKAADKSDISYTNPGSKIKNGPLKGQKAGRLGYWDISKFGGATPYKSLDELATANCNNPTILWMYELEEEYIKDSRGPIYDETEKSYKFTFEFLPMESTVKYREVMKVQLATNAGMGVDDLGFNQLILEVVLCENGMIRAINVNAQYQMKMDVPVLGYINSAVNLTATQLFSYNPNEEGYKIDEHLNAF